MNETEDNNYPRNEDHSRSDVAENIFSDAEVRPRRIK